MAVRVRNRRGKEVTLLNPAERAKKFSCELKHGVVLTNDFVEKTDRKGVVKELDIVQRAFRSGYLQARKDNAKAFKHNQKFLSYYG